MKNLGSRWTVPDIARTAAARSSFLVAISSERDSGSSRPSRNRSNGSRDSIKRRGSNVRSNGSGSDSNGIGSIGGGIRANERATTIENKRVTRGIGGSAVGVLLHEATYLSVRSYVTASSDRIDGTTRPESTTRHRPVAGKSRGSQRRYRPRQPPQPQPPQQQPLYNHTASWDTRTLHFRNC
ncbi:hypothetical protein WN55_05146 [Dufourea novaeangliae]|uniref:Uncharacterized protein n=1 Tax=Dufourea novaeangliae TaxID=178035 RepID=A0A154PQE4_DUFNO|nr:hypothetical protein WN55_05146 [Dufourea novaeangliae]